MISFIVIGRNEGWKLTKCFEGIYAAIAFNKLSEYEVIYIDSKSSDDSIERASVFPEIKIFKIAGECNPAIARNIGANESRGDVLFFIDGDMEIMPDYLNLVYSSDKGLIEKFISGNWINYHYSDFKDRKPIAENPKKHMEKDSYEYTVGGLFLINRELWFSVGGMKNKLKRSQDWDLALRLAQRDVFLLRKKEFAAIHHTYFPKSSMKRSWELFFMGAKYYKLVLTRDEFLSKLHWKQFLRINYTFFALIINMVTALVLNDLLLMVIYPLILLIRILLRKQYSPLIVLSSFIQFLIFEVTIPFAWLLFWPRNHELSYIQLKREDKE